MAMTPEQLLDAMQRLEEWGDNEMRHIKADDLMCAVLSDLGYGEAVAVFNRMGKWYA